jgi:hypothetical protein
MNELTTRFISLRSITTSGLFTLCLTCSAAASDDDFFSNIDISDIDVSEVQDRPLQYSGWLKQSLSYGLAAPREEFSRSQAEMNGLITSVQGQVDWQQSSKMSYRFALRALYDAHYQLQSNDVSQEELSELEARVELKDAYVDAELADNLYLRFGNQIIAWGEADTLTITDVVARKDLRTFGQADLEDTRLQVPAAKLSYSLEDTTFEGVLTFQAGSDEIAPSYNEFDPYIRLRSAGADIHQAYVNNAWEYFFRAQHKFAGGEWSLVLADANNNELSVKQIDIAQQAPLITYQQKRFQLIGAAANWVQGLWLWKAETGMRFNTAMAPNEALFFNTTSGWQQHNQLRSMLGLEYVGFGDVSFTFELDHAYTQGDTERLLIDKNQVGFSSRLYWQDVNDELTVQADWTRLLNNQGDVIRLSLDYAWTDALTSRFFLTAYQADNIDQSLYDYRNNDMVAVELKYGF